LRRGSSPDMKLPVCQDRPSGRPRSADRSSSTAHSQRHQGRASSIRSASSSARVRSAPSCRSRCSRSSRFDRSMPCSNRARAWSRSRSTSSRHRSSRRPGCQCRRRRSFHRCAPFPDQGFTVGPSQPPGAQLPGERRLQHPASGPASRHTWHAVGVHCPGARGWLPALAAVSRAAKGDVSVMVSGAWCGPGCGRSGARRLAPARDRAAGPARPSSNSAPTTASRP
jgi:hypothetical protein